MKSWIARRWNSWRGALFVVALTLGCVSMGEAQTAKTAANKSPVESSSARPTTKKVLIDPRSYGFDIEPGNLTPGNEACVLVSDGAGDMVVGKVFVFIGKSAIVLLPDGQLVAKREKDYELTQRPFTSITKEALAKRLLATEFKGFKVKQTKNYLYLYTTSEEFALGTSRILESMLPGVQKYMSGCKIDTTEPDVPLVVVMFRTEEDFQRYRRMPQGVVAYYHTLTNRVMMFEESDLAEHRPDLALQQAISTIAHEGTHQILHNIGVQKRLSMWPMWLSEGIAEFLAPTSVGKRLSWKGAAQVNDLRMFELEQYVKAKGAADPNGDTVKHTVMAGRLTSTGYASAWSLTHYLATKKRNEFNAYLGEMSQLGPFEGALEVGEKGVIEANVAPFEKIFGNNYVDLEKKLIAHLQKLPYEDPFSNQPHFVAQFSYQQGKRSLREAATFHNPILARKWLEEIQDKKQPEGSPRGSIQMFPNRAAAETFARGWLRGN